MPARLHGLIFSLLVAMAMLALLASFANRGFAGGTPPLIISEVAWGGTHASSSDEWIELHNPSSVPVSLTGWRLFDTSGDVNVDLEGTIEAGGFFLLERTADDTISDVAADIIYSGGLNNSGEALALMDQHGYVVDTANVAAGPWPAGEGSPGYLSMERVGPAAADDAAGWQAHDGVTHTALDALGNPVNGTPRRANLGWGTSSSGVDLLVRQRAPATATAGQPLTYEIVISNSGSLAAEGVVVTDVLPLAAAYHSDDSGFPLSRPTPGTLVWTAGTLPASTSRTFELTVTLEPSAAGLITNTLAVATTSAEAFLSNNHSVATTQVLFGAQAKIVIDGVLYDGYEANDVDEAVLLRNVGGVTVDLAGWWLSDGSRNVELPPGLELAAGEAAWLARDASAFRRQFGFEPWLALPEWPGFANSGDEVLLLQPDGRPADVLVYEDGDGTISGWNGPALQAYRSGNQFAEEGQILYRRRDGHNWQPVPDTNSAGDWAQSRDDVTSGRKVQYPGWNMEQFFASPVVTTTANVTVAVAPDNAYETVVRQLNHARTSIKMEAMTFENLGIADALVAAARRGVAVTVLLEGDPVGGLTDQERYACQRVEGAGGACWFMVRDDENAIHDRYRYLHAKFAIVDGKVAIVSSENLSPDSMPYDDKSDGTWGRRGVVLLTDAPPVIERLSAIFADDLAPASHQDLLRWAADHPVYGPPAPRFRPITVTGGTTYTVQFSRPASFAGGFPIRVVQAPENSLQVQAGLLGLLQKAGQGDTVVVQQLSEPPHWGGAASDPQQDPNPRLEAYIDAARRGARVRLLLDKFYDDETSVLSNAATCEYVNGIAAAENLRLRCLRVNPTGLGLHNKMVLVELEGRGWAHVGSLNGTEVSSKGNREVALQVRSDELYSYLLGLFERDWPNHVLLPLVANNYRGPLDYPLISEVMYDPPGPDAAEFIEIVNPGRESIDLSYWIIGDALSPDDYEDTRRFPRGAVLDAQSVFVVAATATGFQAQFGFLPDFEVIDSHPDVLDLTDIPEWGEPAALLQLGNEGDEIWLRRPDGTHVDAVAYGTGAFPELASCPLLPAPGYSLERYPYWHDSADCGADFRAWPYPTPGTLP